MPAGLVLAGADVDRIVEHAGDTQIVSSHGEVRFAVFVTTRVK
jgi:hypothetical protein